MQRIQEYGRKTMDFFRKKVLAKLHPSARLPMAIAAGITILSIILCVIMGARATSTQNSLSSAETKMRRGLQTELNLLIRAQEKASLDKYDLEEDVLPEMRKYIYSLNILNTQIASVFGSDHQPINSALITSFSSALDTLQNTIELKNDTTKTLQLLKDYIDKMQLELY